MNKWAIGDKVGVRAGGSGSTMRPGEVVGVREDGKVVVKVLNAKPEGWKVVRSPRFLKPWTDGD